METWKPKTERRCREPNKLKLEAEERYLLSPNDFVINE